MVSNDNRSAEVDFETFVTPWNERVSCAILFSVCAIFGVASNGIAVSLSIFTKLRHQKVNLFIGNLAASDLMCVLVFLLGQNFYILYRENLPSVGCNWVAFLNFIAAMQEFVFPPFLATNRYVGLYHSTLYDRIYTRRNMASMIGGSWLFSTIVPLIFTLEGRTGYDRRNEHCCLIVEGDTLWTVIYWLVIIGPLIGVCDSTMVFCNWKIYKKLKHHQTSCGGGLKKNVVNENREILYFMIIDMLMPICTHSVYHVSKFAIPNRFSLASRQFFTCLYLINAALRGCVIVLMLRPYRKAFKLHILRIKPNAISATRPETSRKAEVSLNKF